MDLRHEGADLLRPTSWQARVGRWNDTRPGGQPAANDRDCPGLGLRQPQPLCSRLSPVLRRAPQSDQAGQLNAREAARLNLEVGPLGVVPAPTPGVIAGHPAPDRKEVLPGSLKLDLRAQKPIED